jgi:hypothetical protein
LHASAGDPMLSFSRAERAVDKMQMPSFVASSKFDMTFIELVSQRQDRGIEMKPELGVASPRS